MDPTILVFTSGITFIVLMDLGIAFHFFRKFQEMASLSTERGLRAMATVKRLESAGTQSPMQKLDFYFPTMQGRTIDGSAFVPTDELGEFSVGQKIEIAYLQDKPSVFCLPLQIEQKAKIHKVLALALGAGAPITMIGAGIVAMQAI